MGLLFTLVLLTITTNLVTADKPAPSPDLSTITNRFTCLLVNKLLETYPSDQNFIISAFNIEEDLFLLTNAAQSSTLNELCTLFGIPSSSAGLSSVNTQFKNFLNQLSEIQQDTQVQLYASLYVQNGCPLLPAYQKSMSDNYNAITKNVDFRSNSAAVTQEINDSVNKQTHGKISGLFSEPLSSSTRLILLTTLYFHSSWFGGFFTLNKQKSTFNLLSQGSKQIQCINNHNGEKPAGYTTLDSCQIARIPYQDTKYSLFVFLPPQGQHPRVCYQKLTAEKISNLYSTTNNQQSVNITLPRFDIATTLSNMVPDFKKLGVNQAFVNADLSRGIDQRKCGGLAVDQIIHKALMEVNENGTTAAAATATRVVGLAVVEPPPDPIQFDVNRPFAVSIACSNPPVFLFTGMVLTPTYP